MEAKDVLNELRQRHNMTQDQLSEKLAVTRQAVSRWENGESVPNPHCVIPPSIICWVTLAS